MTPSVVAIEAAERLGLAVTDPVLVQETNNTVLWLAPHPVIAKVGTGFAVTFWDRVDHDADAQPPGSTVGQSLRCVHEALALCDVILPSFRVSLQRARSALGDDARTPALAAVDRAFLRDAFDDLLGELATYSLIDQRLHGEPHDGNRLLTRAGLRWIDFKAAASDRWNGTSPFSPRTPARSSVMSTPSCCWCSKR